MFREPPFSETPFSEDCMKCYKEMCFISVKVGGIEKGHILDETRKNLGCIGRSLTPKTYMFLILTPLLKGKNLLYNNVLY